MIIKQRDSLRMRKLELEILRKFNLPPDKAFLVEQEWKSLHSGEKGENDAAYYIDYCFGDSKNYAVIHDLRLEHRGKVAQIDHLLIGRMLDMYVLETKAYGEKLEIKDDWSFVARYSHKSFAVPSPVEQNKRHIQLLQKILQDKDVLPKRMGVTIPAQYFHCVLLSPKTELLRPKGLDTNCVQHADKFSAWHEQRVDQFGVGDVLMSMGKIVSEDTLRSLAQSLCNLYCKSDQLS